MKRLGLFGLAVMTAFSAHAAGRSEKLVTLTNDRDSGVSEIAFTIDEAGTLKGLVYTSRNEAGTRVKKFTMAQLASSEGAVLEEEQGVKALVLKGRPDASTGAGPMAFRYVANGLTGSYKECPVSVRREGSSWVMKSSSGATVRRGKLLTWSLGISTIQGVCD